MVLPPTSATTSPDWAVWTAMLLLLSPPPSSGGPPYLEKDTRLKAEADAASESSRMPPLLPTTPFGVATAVAAAVPDVPDVAAAVVGAVGAAAAAEAVPGAVAASTACFSVALSPCASDPPPLVSCDCCCVGLLLLTLLGKDLPATGPAGGSTKAPDGFRCCPGGGGPGGGALIIPLDLLLAASSRATRRAVVLLPLPATAEESATTTAVVVPPGVAGVRDREPRLGGGGPMREPVSGGAPLGVFPVLCRRRSASSATSGGCVEGGGGFPTRDGCKLFGACCCSPGANDDDGAVALDNSGNGCGGGPRGGRASVMGALWRRTGSGCLSLSSCRACMGADPGAG